MMTIQEVTALVLLYRACKNLAVKIRAEDLVPGLKEHANVVVPFEDELRKIKDNSLEETD